VLNFPCSIVLLQPSYPLIWQAKLNPMGSPVKFALHAAAVIVGLLVGLYLVVLGLFWVNQRALLYPAPSPRQVELGAGTVVSLPLPDGGESWALHLPAPEDGPTAVYFHGNGEQVADLPGYAADLREAGIGFLAVEYPGYGGASGHPTEAGLYAAAQTALCWLRAQGVPRESIVLYGRSLGTGVATEMAHRGHGSKLLLVSPFTSVVEAAGDLYPIFPTGLLVKDRYDNAKKAPQVPIQVLIIHGRADRLVPFSHGERLAQRFPSAELLGVDGAGHNDVMRKAAIQARVVSFIRDERAATARAGRAVAAQEDSCSGG
jgi:uncharacterized protein